MRDSYDLERFVAAQEQVMGQVLAELRRGAKEGHWMWFIFPQIEGLGYSALSREFAISSTDEARAYLNHPVLGQRLRECTQLVMSIPDGIGIREIFGYPDFMKFRSCMTLFAEIAQDEQIFRDALKKYFDGKPDTASLMRLQSTRE